MNEEKFKKGIEDLKKVGLTNSEKLELKSKLDFYVNKNTPNIPVKSSWYSQVSFLHMKMYSTAFAVLLLAVVGVGTYSEAEKSLPGDTLYSLKVGVIEPLKYTAATTEVEKANLEALNLDTRLREAEILEVQGKLTDAVSDDLQKRISSHSESFNKILTELNSQKKLAYDSDLEIDFEARMNAHSRVIDSIQDSTQGSNITKIKKYIVKKDEVGADSPVVMTMAKSMMFSSEASLAVATTSDNIGTSTDNIFNQRKKDTEEIIKSARKNIEKNRKSLKANKKILDEAESLISDAEKSLNDADMQIQSGDREGAKQFLINSRIRAKEANTSMELSQDLSKDRD